MSAVTALYGNVAHTFEHYGNMITYMRMKGLVPPSTEHDKAGAVAIAEGRRMTVRRTLSVVALLAAVIAAGCGEAPPAARPAADR